MSFQKVVKLLSGQILQILCFRTVSFQKVVKPEDGKIILEEGFRTVSFQKVVKLGGYVHIFT